MSGLQGLWQHRRTLGRRAAMAGAIAAALFPVAALAADMDARFKAPPSPYDWTVTIGLEGRQLTDAIALLLQHQDVYGYTFAEGRYDTGKKLDYLRAMVEFAIRRDDHDHQ